MKEKEKTGDDGIRDEKEDGDDVGLSTKRLC